MQLQKLANKLGKKSFRLQNLPKHNIYAEHTEAKRKYDSTLHYTKRQH
jgi:hypothetical protein